jgi:hypothetical protein
MKPITKIVSVLLLTVILFYSCKKSSTGGDVTLVAIPKHHSTPIKGATIYVKFKADEFPSDIVSNYDLKIVGEENEEHVHIEGLRYGKYFLYAVGYDSTIMSTVSGGIPVKIKWKERKEELDIDIPVIE